jgi:segregation and condensation protein B
LQRGLIAEVGRMATVGRPMLYGTTDEFLRQFGLTSVADLPPREFPSVDE